MINSASDVAAEGSQGEMRALLCARLVCWRLRDTLAELNSVLGLYWCQVTQLINSWLFQVCLRTGVI